MRRERALAGSIGLLAVAAPLALGGAHPVTQVALSAACCALFVAYLRLRGSRGLRLFPLAIVAGAAVAWSLVQLIPLPSGVVAWASPHAFEIRSDIVRTAWMPLTLDVPATLLEVVKGAGCAGLLLVVGGFARSRGRARSILAGVALSGVALAVLICLHRLLGAQAIYGIYRVRSMPGSGFFGSFVNGNHAASVLALSALTCAGFVAHTRGGDRFAAMIGLVASVSALLFTMSRAGVIGFAIGGFVFTAVLLTRRLPRPIAIGIAAVMLIAGGAGALWLGEGLRARLLGGEPSALLLNQKTRGWVDALRLVRDYEWTGVGRGSFASAIGAYRAVDETVRLVYPENLFLQWASECGVPIAAALIAATIVLLWRRMRLFARLEAPALGAACGVLAVAVHELADFGLEMSGVAIPVAIALGVVLARSGEGGSRQEPERSSPSVVPQRVGLALAAAWLLSLAGGAWAVPRTLDADFDRAQHAFVTQAPSAAQIIGAAVSRHPADDHLELLASEQAMRSRDDSVMRHLNRAQRLHPAGWQSHRLTAVYLARAGRSAQAALEYRLGLERGMPLDHDELMRTTGEYVVDAVPQQPRELLALAGALSVRHESRLAMVAATRAATAALDAQAPDVYEAAQLLRIQLASTTRNTEAVQKVARELAQHAQDAASFVAAADALSAAGLSAEARETLERGLSMHPQSAVLVIATAQARVRQKELAAARALLRRLADSDQPLEHRRRAEELLAEIADQLGDVEQAVLARGRARMLARQMGQVQ